MDNNEYLTEILTFDRYKLVSFYDKNSRKEDEQILW